MLDLDSQQLLASGMALGTSELLNSVLDNKLSQELNQGLQINDPAVSHSEKYFLKIKLNLVGNTLFS